MFKRWRIVILVLAGMVIGVLMSITLGRTDSYHARTNSVVLAKNARPWGHSIKGKFRRSFDINILAPGGVSVHNPSNLKAEVMILQATSQKLNYQWVLPNGVELVAGDLSGEIENPQVGQTVFFEIVVKNFGGSGIETIALQVFEEKDGAKVGAAGAISSQQEPIAVQLSGVAKVGSPQTPKPRLRE